MIDPPRVIRRTISPLDPERARVFLKAGAGKPLEAFFVVGLACGLRLGEILGLQWADVDFEATTLRVSRAVQRTGGDVVARRPLLATRKRILRELQSVNSDDCSAGRTEREARLLQELATVRAALAKVKTSVQLTEPKSDRSRRTISLPPVVSSALRAHRVRQLEARLLTGSRWQEGGFVFASEPNVGQLCFRQDGP